MTERRLTRWPLGSRGRYKSGDAGAARGDDGSDDRDEDPGQRGRPALNGARGAAKRPDLSDTRTGRGGR